MENIQVDKKKWNWMKDQIEIMNIRRVTGVKSRMRWNENIR